LGQATYLNELHNTDLIYFLYYFVQESDIIRLDGLYLIGSNDVLTTNNLVLQADRALSGMGFDAGSMFDLAALVEAVVLHDHLIFLKTPSQFDFDSLPLGHILLNEGIIQSFEPPVSILEMQESIYHLFGIPDAYDKVSASPFTARLGSPSILPYYGEYDFFSPNRVKTILAEVELARQLPAAENIDRYAEDAARILPHYCFSLVEMWAGNNAWARRPAQAFLVRTLVYWTISDRLNISFYPDFARIPIVNEISNELENSLLNGGYQAIANAFYIPLEELKRLSAPIEVPLPPLTMLLLESAASHRAIGKNLIKLREEFSDLRRSFGDYESAIRAITSLGELVQARRDLIEAASYFSKNYALPERRLIRETTSYFHRAAHVGDNLHNSSSSSSDLFFKPVEWIKEWWLLRNAIHIFDIKAKLTHIQDYSRLWQKLFQKSLTENELVLYQDFVEALQS
jgi:hypothetical protein